MIRAVRGIIRDRCFYDREKREEINLLTRREVLGILQSSMPVWLVPDLTRGEVLIDTRGEGTLQRAEGSWHPW